MNVLVYDVHSYNHTFFDAANQARHKLTYTAAQLDEQTAALAQGYEAVCLFVNDKASEPVLARLARGGTRLIVQRSTDSTISTSSPLLGTASPPCGCRTTRPTPSPSLRSVCYQRSIVASIGRITVPASSTFALPGS